MPVCSLGAQAIDQGTPPFSVRGHPLHFSPGVSHLLCFFFRVSLPGVSWPTSSPLPWVVPFDGSLCFNALQYILFQSFVFFDDVYSYCEAA